MADTQVLSVIIWSLVAVALVTIGLAVAIWLTHQSPQSDLSRDVVYGLATFVLGMFGAVAFVVASYLGFQNYETLPQQIFTRGWLAVYLVIGGGWSVMFWSTAPSSFTPVIFAGIGATWPAALHGLTVPQKAVQEANKQLADYKASVGLAGDS